MLAPGRAAEDCLGSRHRPVVPGCRADQQLVSEATVSPSAFPHHCLPAQSTPHLLSSPRSRPLAPPCTSANGGVKVNVGFLVDGPEDRRVIGRISLSWNMKVLPTPGWVACHTMTVPMTAYLAPVHLHTA